MSESIVRIILWFQLCFTFHVFQSVPWCSIQPGPKKMREQSSHSNLVAFINQLLNLLGSKWQLKLRTSNVSATKISDLKLFVNAAFISQKILTVSNQSFHVFDVLFFLQPSLINVPPALRHEEPAIPTANLRTRSPNIHRRCVGARPHCSKIIHVQWIPLTIVRNLNFETISSALLSTINDAILALHGLPEQHSFSWYRRYRIKIL